AAFDATVPDRGIESHRYRRGRGIAMLADGQDDSFHGKVEPLRGRADDADVRLVWDEPVDLALLEVVFLDDVVDEVLERLHGDLENLVAFHAQGRTLAL